MAKHDDPHSIHNEPVYAPPASKQPSEVHQEPALGNRQLRDNDSDIAAQSVWDEVGTQGLGYEVPEDALSYSNWYASKSDQCSILRSYSTVFIIALIGGPLAILAVLLGGTPNAESHILAVVFWGPVLEEQLKIAGTLILLERFPYLYRSSLQLYFAIVASALSFSVLENLMYLNVYIEDPSPEIVAWRWSVCTALHVGASSIAFLGVRKMWKVSRSTLTPPSVKEAFPYLVMATVVHGSYNLFAILLEEFLKPF